MISTMKKERETLIHILSYKIAYSSTSFTIY